MRLVLVDVDGTLLRGPSSERRFIRHLLLAGRLGLRQLTAFAAFPLRYGRRFGRAVWAKNKAYLAGLPVGRVEAWGASFAATHLLPRVRADLAARLRAHQAAGDVVALLTGTPDFLARPLARGLGISRLVATRCAVAGGRFTDRPPLLHPFGPEKVVQARRLAAALGLSLAAAVAYADSIHDLPLFLAVGEAVPVSPDRRLRAQAGARGWRPWPVGV